MWNLGILILYWGYQPPLLRIGKRRAPWLKPKKNALCSNLPKRLKWPNGKLSLLMFLLLGTKGWPWAVAIYVHSVYYFKAIFWILQFRKILDPWMADLRFWNALSSWGWKPLRRIRTKRAKIRARNQTRERKPMQARRPSRQTRLKNRPKRRRTETRRLKGTTSERRRPTAADCQSWENFAPNLQRVERAALLLQAVPQPEDCGKRQQQKRNKTNPRKLVGLGWALNFNIWVLFGLPCTLGELLIANLNRHYGFKKPC